ncbi:MAG: radical SAM protein [Caldilineaceae bacterium]|nr:radical SAM protein [Caldilineaceae bacterium]
MTKPILQTPRPASGALTKTSGFLAGFTHTLQPYIGCRFGCEYCYVKGLQVHRLHQPLAEWGDYVHPRVGIDTKLRQEVGRLAAKQALAQTAIFMSSATDPYQGLERQWRLSRACLDVLLDYPPGLLVIQTRSPLVAEDFARLHALGDRCWLNFTLETDRDDVRQALTPRCPSIAKRLQTLQQAQAAGLQVQITVSPCLPFSSVPTFGELLLAHGQRVIVDTYTSGDGQAGRRTAQTLIPGLYQNLAWADWRSEEAAQALYDWLHTQIGERAGWSQAGFATLTKAITAA